MNSPYEIKKEGAMYLVIAKSTGIVQYRNLRRSMCKDWISKNTSNEQLVLGGEYNVVWIDELVKNA